MENMEKNATTHAVTVLAKEIVFILTELAYLDAILGLLEKSARQVCHRIISNMLLILNCLQISCFGVFCTN